MSFVQVPPDSTGKKIDTITVGGQERQVVVIGDDGTGTDLLTQLKAVQEEIKQLNDNLLIVMMAIFEKMPRVTGADQAAVSVENAPNISTCATVTTLNELRYVTGKSAFGDNINLAGCQHIYNNIVVS